MSGRPVSERAHRKQASILTGYKRSSRDAYVQRLRRKGYLHPGGGIIVATDAGVDALGADFEPLPTKEALHRALAVAVAAATFVECPRRAQVIELQFFGGLTVEETAAALQVSPQTVMRDWKLARAWLAVRLNPRQSSAS